MEFERSIYIQCAPEGVFAFLRDKDMYPQKEGSPVLVLEKTSEGPVGVGTHYREVVRMLPWVEDEITSVITRYEPPYFLEEDFKGGAMHGHLAYEFQAQGEGTLLIQRESIHYSGVLRLLEPLIGFFLLRKIEERLEAIKTIVEVNGIG
jgi:hypothetical protein